MDTTGTETEGSATNTTKPVLTSFYFTFGCGSPLAKYFVKIEASDELHARAKMVAMFSSHWASVYTDYSKMINYTRLNVNREASVRLCTNHEELPPDLYKLAFHED